MLSPKEKLEDISPYMDILSIYRDNQIIDFVNKKRLVQLILRQLKMEGMKEKARIFK